MGSLELDLDEVRWASLLLIDLILRPKEWIHRRVETVAFADDCVVTRRVDIEFSVPRPADSLKVYFPSDAQQIVLPLAVMRKKRVPVFDLVDDSGRHYPMLTRATRTEVAQGALLMLATEVLGAAIDRRVDRDLREMASSAIPIAYKRHKRFRSASQLSEDALDGASREVKQRARLFRNPAFRVVAYSLTWSYVLLVPVPNEPGTRRRMSYAYEERPPDRPRRASDVQDWVADERQSSRPERTSWRLRQGWRAFGRALGWSPRRFWFTCASVAYGHTYHFEVEAPRGTQISKSALYLTTGWSPRRNPYVLSIDAAIDLLRRREHAADWQRWSLRRSHLYVGNTPNTGYGIVEIELRPERETFVQGIALTALLSLILLAAGLYFRPRLDAGTGTTLLLLLPTVLVAYVVQPGAEHAMAARLLTAVRTFGILIGLCLLGASGALIVAHKGQPSSLTAWRLALYLTAVATVVLVGAWLKAWPRRYRASSTRGDW